MMKKGLILSVFALALAACTTVIDQRGVTVDPDKLKQIQIGTTTLPEVGNLLGSPAATNNFGDPTWYYISEQTETWAFRNPKIKEQNVVIVRFDKGGVVQAVEQKDLKDAQKVDTVKATTPAAESQMTILQQLLGNVGRFNGQESTK